MSTTAEKYIIIEEQGSTPTGKTFRWRVRNTRSNDICGLIQWYGGFMKYVFYPSDGFNFDASCLRMIADHLELVNAKHYAHRKGL